MSYSLAVAEAARKRGITSFILASVELSPLCHPNTGVFPAFRSAYQSSGKDSALRAFLFGLGSRLPKPLAAQVAPPLRALRRKISHARADCFAIELSAHLRNIGAQESDLVLLHSVSSANLAGLTSVSLPCTVAVVLRRTPADMDLNDAAPEPIAALLRRLSMTLGVRLRLFADTSSLRKIWLAELGIEVVELPLPVIVPLRSTRPAFAIPHLVFPGGARLEKGYTLLPGLVKNLGAGARFTIHSGPIRLGSDPMVQQAHALLLRAPNVTLLERELSFEEYQALLSAADLVLLPYDAGAYGPRSSAILAETRAAGVPAVVPAGCWMEDEVGPDPALVFCGSAKLTTTVQSALVRLPALKVAYAAAAPAWRARHNPDTMLDCLLQKH